MTALIAFVALLSIGAIAGALIPRAWLDGLLGGGGK